jgi:hypothetical protein
MMRVEMVKRLPWVPWRLKAAVVVRLLTSVRETRVPQAQRDGPVAAARFTPPIRREEQRGQGGSQAGIRTAMETLQVPRRRAAALVQGARAPMQHLELEEMAAPARLVTSRDSRLLMAVVVVVANALPVAQLDPEVTEVETEALRLWGKTASWVEVAVVRVEVKMVRATVKAGWVDLAETALSSFATR